MQENALEMAMQRGVLEGWELGDVAAELLLAEQRRLDQGNA